MIIIAGAGIAGLSLGLTCHQLGLPFKIFEKAQRIKPLGVGINIQPTATRELVALNLLEGLESIGVKTRELSFFTKTAQGFFSFFEIFTNCFIFFSIPKGEVSEPIILYGISIVLNNSLVILPCFLC